MILIRHYIPLFLFQRALICTAIGPKFEVFEDEFDRISPQINHASYICTDLDMYLLPFLSGFFLNGSVVNKFQFQILASVLILHNFIRTQLG